MYLTFCSAILAVTGLQAHVSFLPPPPIGTPAQPQGVTATVPLPAHLTPAQMQLAASMVSMWCLFFHSGEPLGFLSAIMWHPPPELNRCPLASLPALLCYTGIQVVPVCSKRARPHQLHGSGYLFPYLSIIQRSFYLCVNSLNCSDNSL